MTGFGGQVEEVALSIPEQRARNNVYMKQTSRHRNWCLKITCSPWLDFVSKFVILLDCVALAMYKPYEQKSATEEVLQGVVFAFFIVEMLIKMVALGVFGYLSNHWNKFDVFINSGKLLDYVLASFGIPWEISKALGPVRLMGREPSMRAMVKVLLDTAPMLANVLVLYIFIVHIFAVVGVQLWAGQLLNRCFLGEDIPAMYNMSLSPYYMSAFGEKVPFICSPDNKNGMLRCSDVPPYMEDGEICSSPAPHHVPELVPAVAGDSADTSCVNWNMYYNICRAGDLNPHMGAVSFDNIGYAWSTIFQVITLEGWAEIMFFVMDAHSFWSFVFFILVTIMGSFIMMNVCAVVIATQFSENMKTTTGDQGVGAGSIAHIFHKLTCWVEELYSRYYSRHNRVHPDGSRKDSSLIQAWIPFQRKLKRMVRSKLFDRVIMFVVFLSVLTMAIEHHKQPKELTSMLKICNNIFTFVFVVEMILKLMALSWRYFCDPNNIFDFAIVMISLWELIAKADGKMSVMRAFRLLRFVRLVHFLPYLKQQLLVLKITLQKAAVLCGLLVFFMLIFSVLGMQLFGDKFSYEAPNGDIITDRKNFDNLLWSMVTVFQILTLEDWNLVQSNAMAATSPWAALYFVALNVIGRHVLLNILVGIVVQSFQDRSTNEESISSVTDDETNSSSVLTQDCSAPEDKTAPTDTSEDYRSLSLIQRVLAWCKDHEEWSFYVFSPQNRFRVCLQRLISHTAFDHVILFFILLSCVTIAMERPEIDPQSMERWILDISNYVFSAVFLVEMIFKVLALGLLFGKENYCQSSWNMVDGLLVFLSFVDIFVSLASTGNNRLGILKVLRLLRTLRPLRVIKRAPKLKLAVEALIASVKPIGNIVLICCAFFFFFGILGVQLFKGKFYHCVGEDIRHINSKSDCLTANYLWKRKTYNFDSLPQALMALFVMYSKDGWMNVMYDGLDASEVDKQPVMNHNEWMLLFFIPFMVLSFVLLDMFVGVMVETFHHCQQEQKKGDEHSQKEAGEAGEDQSKVETPYYAHYSPIRQSIHTLCTSNFLDLFMTFIIVLSVLVMAFEHYNQPQWVEKLVEYSYHVATAILIIEVLLKLLAFGVLRFLNVSWNLLDVAIVIVSIISIIFNEMNVADAILINPSILRVFRILRLAQVLKAKKIRVLLKTIIKTLSQVGNICLLFMFFFFIYDALGVELFGKLECTEDNPCLALNRHANFKHFGKALLTLYQVCTGDNWSNIMKDTLRECHPGDNSCSSYLSWASPIYYSTFAVTAQFVLVNLVVAAIMQALEDSSVEEEAVHTEPAQPSPGESGTSSSTSRIRTAGPSE